MENLSKTIMKKKQGKEIFHQEEIQIHHPERYN